ncbi:hypothetical protein [Erythrobacter aureus]|uniref:hypothetical protein n=1 Tax=Erythrobacter aureus TaxID=2182384 RepID=UPI003A938E77
MAVDLTLNVVAQLAVGVAAIAALFVGPWFAFNNSRRLAVAQSRQDWLNDLRADVARVIALHGELVVHRQKQEFVEPGEPDPAGIMLEIGERVALIRMRLNVQKPNQLALHEALTRFVCEYGGADPSELVSAMDLVVAEVWRAIKRGRI